VRVSFRAPEGSGQASVARAKARRVGFVIPAGAGIKIASASAGRGENPRGFFLVGSSPGRDKQAKGFFRIS